MRLGELLALRWEDVDLDGHRVIVHRAVSANVEGPTKSWQARTLPLADPAASGTRPADRPWRLHRHVECIGSRANGQCGCAERQGGGCDRRECEPASVKPSSQSRHDEPHSPSRRNSSAILDSLRPRVKGTQPMFETIL
jgi:hypothetical protein